MSHCHSCFYDILFLALQACHFKTRLNGNREYTPVRFFCSLRNPKTVKMEKITRFFFFSHGETREEEWLTCSPQFLPLDVTGWQLRLWGHVWKWVPWEIKLILFSKYPLRGLFIFLCLFVWTNPYPGVGLLWLGVTLSWVGWLFIMMCSLSFCLTSGLATAPAG